MRGLTVPAQTEDFTADPVELFFDLAFVFAFSQMVGVLVHDPDWTHVGRMALLFGLLWLPWQQFTWSANAVPGNSRQARLFLLAGTVVSVPMAASISSAFGAGGTLFAICVVLIFGLGIALMLVSAERGSDLLQSATRWGSINILAMVLLVAGSVTEGSARTGLWIAALVVIIIATVLAGRGEWMVRPGHMAERHGLITIIALGEVIVAIGIPVVEAFGEGESISGTTIAVLVATGGFAGLMWWSYFDRVSPALEHRAEQLIDRTERGRFVRTVYTWWHAALVGGIILAAAALEEMALHPSEAPPVEVRAMFAGGLALSTFGVAASIWAAFRVAAAERIIAITVVSLLILFAAGISGLGLVLIVDALLLVMLVVENRRIEH